jgi:hypothetical protein
MCRRTRGGADTAGSFVCAVDDVCAKAGAAAPTSGSAAKPMITISDFHGIS